MLVEDMAGFRFDPLGHVLYSYPWGVEGTELAERAGPWPWQREFLESIGARLKAGEAVHFADIVREACASGHGIGKSAVVAWLIRWALDTFEDARVLVTANTDTQLRTKTWPELLKWHHLGITRRWWVATATAIYAADPDHAANWRADAVPWSEHNTEAFAGLHNLGKRLVVIFDEASKIADKVWEVAEGALTDANTEIIWAVFGNPTQATGRFRECFRHDQKRWKTRQIDSRSVPGTNRKLHEQWVEDYGEDSDFVKVRVRGIFPSMSVNALISEVDVDAAFGRPLRKSQFDFAPVILACDPAWWGDDLLCIGRRRGLLYQILEEIPKNDNDAFIAQKLAQYEDEEGWEADAVFIDLGHGTGIASVGKMWGRSWDLVSFAEASNNPGCLNKRAEMYVAGRDWLKQGGSIPKSGVGAMQLREELLATELKNPPRPDGRLQLIEKDAIKEVLGRSPGHADTWALTFARPVQKRDRAPSTAPRGFVEANYQPLKRRR